MFESTLSPYYIEYVYNHDQKEVTALNIPANLFKDGKDFIQGKRI